MVPFYISTVLTIVAVLGLYNIMCVSNPCPSNILLSVLCITCHYSEKENAKHSVAKGSVYCGEIIRADVLTVWMVLIGETLSTIKVFARLSARFGQGFPRSLVGW